MHTRINRRQFGKYALIAGLGSYTVPTSGMSAPDKNVSKKATSLTNKIALNAYSFNRPLRDGSMDLFNLLEYCSDLGIDGVDLTGYYFPGYPTPPPNTFIYEIKKRAFEMGLHICGTGVRNDFCNPDKKNREMEKKLVKDWILVAEKLGAPAIRTFTGKDVPEGYTWNQASEWIADDYLECAAFGKEHGVVIEIQNHNDFLKTAKQVSTLLDKINSEWIGLMLDIGSYRTADPYIEIKETIKYAVNWQLKERVFVNQKTEPVNLSNLKDIILNSDYKGYIPIETLGEGDPKVKVREFYKEIIAEFR